MVTAGRPRQRRGAGHIAVTIQRPGFIQASGPTLNDTSQETFARWSRYFGDATGLRLFEALRGYDQDLFMDRILRLVARELLFERAVTDEGVSTRAILEIEGAFSGPWVRSEGVTFHFKAKQYWGDEIRRHFNDTDWVSVVQLRDDYGKKNTGFIVRYHCESAALSETQGLKISSGFICERRRQWRVAVDDQDILDSGIVPWVDADDDIRHKSCTEQAYNRFVASSFFAACQDFFAQIGPTNPEL